MSRYNIDMNAKIFSNALQIGELIRERNIEIVGADPVTSMGFTQVPNFILTKDDISVGAKLTYAMLLKYAWDNEACFPGQERLARDMGSGERSIRNYLNELEASELLEIKQRGLGRTNVYRLFLAVRREKQNQRRSRPANSATPDRQNLPVKIGRYSRSGPEKTAGHSI